MSETKPLTDREREVAVLFARGLTYEEIAAASGMTMSGVRYFSEVIRRKLGVEARRQIGPALVGQGLARPDELVAA